MINLSGYEYDFYEINAACYDMQQAHAVIRGNGRTIIYAGDAPIWVIDVTTDNPIKIIFYVVTDEKKLKGKVLSCKLNDNYIYKLFAAVSIFFARKKFEIHGPRSSIFKLDDVNELKYAWITEGLEDIEFFNGDETSILKIKGWLRKRIIELESCRSIDSL